MNDCKMFTFRNIEKQDEVGLLKLRNTPTNLDFFKNPSPISPEDHAKWFASRINDFKEHQIVAVLSNELVGVIYLDDIAECTGSISINIDPEYQSLGIGRELLARIMLRAESLKFIRVEAVIHVANTKSIKLFEKYGFAVEEKISEFFIRYVRFICQKILK